MTDPNSDEFDPTAREQREIGREMVDQSTGLGSVMAHASGARWSRQPRGGNVSTRQPRGR